MKGGFLRTALPSFRIRQIDPESPDAARVDSGEGLAVLLVRAPREAA